MAVFRLEAAGTVSVEHSHENQWPSCAWEFPFYHLNRTSSPRRLNPSEARGTVARECAECSFGKAPTPAATGRAAVHIGGDVRLGRPSTANRLSHAVRSYHDRPGSAGCRICARIPSGASVAHGALISHFGAAACPAGRIGLLVSVLPGSPGKALGGGLDA